MIRHLIGSGRLLIRSSSCLAFLELEPIFWQQILGLNSELGRQRREHFMQKIDVLTNVEREHLLDDIHIQRCIENYMESSRQMEDVEN